MMKKLSLSKSEILTFNDALLALNPVPTERGPDGSPQLAKSPRYIFDDQLTYYIVRNIAKLKPLVDDLTKVRDTIQNRHGAPPYSPDVARQINDDWAKFLNDDTKEDVELFPLKWSRLDVKKNPGLPHDRLANIESLLFFDTNYTSEGS